MNEIQKVSDILVRWYMVVYRNGQKFEVEEQTAEEIIKADKIIVLRDNQNRLIRYINKADIADIYWDKTITKEKFLANENKLIK